MNPGFEFSFQEGEPALDTLNGFGQQLLEIATEREDGALAEGIEQLVFRHPDGIGFKTIDPNTLQLFIEANAPMYNFTSVLQGWRDTDGLVESAHVWWRLRPDHYEVFGQIRGRQLEGDSQCALQCKITMGRQVGDICTTAADVQIGDLDQLGNFRQGLSLAYSSDRLSVPTDSQADQQLSSLVNEMRSIFTYAELIEGNGVSVYRYPIVI